MDSIQVERLGSTERMTFDAFAEFEVQDEDAAVAICIFMLKTGQSYTDGADEHFVRYTTRDTDALRKQLHAAQESLRAWQENHGVPAEAQGFQEREV